MSWRGTYNFQGGAIYANTGANMEIHDTIFEGNLARYVSSSKSGLRTFLKFLLQFMAGDMQQPSNVHYSRDSARIATKLGAKVRGKCQLSFAQAFFSTFDEKNYLKISLEFPAGHMELSANGRRSINSAPTATKLGSKGRGECRLSFALPSTSSFVRELSVK
jgi:hypothetical protein